MKKTEETSKIIFYNEGRNNSTKYTLGDCIGEGTMGRVYLVKGENDEKLVLKQCKEHTFEKSFKSVTDNAYANPAKHFITIKSIGTYHKEGQEGENYRAVIMEYGGSDLNETIKVTSTIGESVKRAFNYKVLLTTLAGIEDAHLKNKYHGDLLVKNILSGVDLKDYVTNGLVVSDKKISLEHKLIDNKVYLCDNIDDNEAGTMSATKGSLSREAILLNLYLTDLATMGEPLNPQIGKSRDMYAFFALWGLLEKGNCKYSVEAFTESKELSMKQDKKGTREFSPINKIREKLLEEIKASGYFSHRTRDDEIYVFRPIDTFRHQWLDKKLMTTAEFEEFSSSNADSYVALSQKSGTNRFSDNPQNKALRQPEEQQQMTQLYADILLKNVQILKEDIKGKTKQRISLNELMEPLSDEMTRLKLEHESVQNTWKDLESKLNETSSKAKEDRSFHKLAAAIAEQMDQVETDLGLKKDVIKRKEEEFNQYNNEYDRLSCDEQNNTLNYIKDNCLNKIKTTNNYTELEKLVTQ